jgi:hypothetical protein
VLHRKVESIDRWRVQEREDVIEKLLLVHDLSLSPSKCVFDFLKLALQIDFQLFEPRGLFIVSAPAVARTEVRVLAVGNDPSAM